jgi:hypothetical protein
MNYCRLTEVLAMSREEVFVLLSRQEDTYYDLEERRWRSSPTQKCIRVKGKMDENFLYLEISRMLREDYDEYVNQVTMLSWIDLKRFLNADPEIGSLWNAGFLLDIAERNCIPLLASVKDSIIQFKSEIVLVPFADTGSKDYDFRKYLQNCNKVCYEVLNLVVKDGAYCRV